MGAISLALSLLVPASSHASEPPASVAADDECAQLGQLYVEIQSHECELQLCRDPSPKLSSEPLEAAVRGRRAWANSRCAALYDGVFEGYKAACGVDFDYNSTTFKELGKVITYYQEAYLCTPGIEHADYLHRALWRIASAQEALERARVKFAADALALPAIEAKLATLKLRKKEISALLPPPLEAAIELHVEPPEESPTEAPAEPKAAHLARTLAFLEMISLRIVGGIGGVKEMYPGGVFLRREGGAYGFGISGSLRHRLGAKRRHIIETGSEYVIIQRMGEGLRSPRKGGCGAPDVCGLAPAMQYLSASLGYGYRILQQQLTVHARVGIGVHVLVNDPGFGRRFGLVGISACSVWEILCVNLTARGSGGLFSKTNLTSGLATLEVDLLRIPAARRFATRARP